MLKISRRLLAFSAASLCTLALSAVPAVRAADHGDPPPRSERDVPLEARLTDLYAFIRDGNLVLILNSNPAVDSMIIEENEFEFPSNVRFEINIDRHTQINFDAADPDLLGGQILNPAGIAPDIVFTIETPEGGEPKLKARGFSLGKHQFLADLKDDPFIRSNRCGANVAAIVLQVPLEDIRLANEPLLIWATSSIQSHHSPSGFEQVDHAGRALRSMFLNNDRMNILPPSEHQRNLGVPPDVIILNPDNLTMKEQVKFPNGREIEDDVVDAVDSPVENTARFCRINDKPFLNTFPYLADSHKPIMGPMQCPTKP